MHDEPQGAPGRPGDGSIRRLDGANMDIDLSPPPDHIAWDQDRCPWNVAEDGQDHRCAVKDVSICSYSCEIEFLDSVLSPYPGENPRRGSA